MKLKLYKYLLAVTAVCLAHFSYGQSRTVSGAVSTLDGNIPLGGVSVLVTGTEVATVTTSDGRYSMNVPAGKNELQFLFVGFETETVTLTTANVVNVSMKEALFDLGETVVTAIGVKKEVKSLGFAVTQVKAKELTESGERSILNSLQGKVAGVNISQSSTDPGASTRILIRGISSMTQGNQPLFVIDGVPMTNVSINSTSSAGGDALNAGFDFGNGANAVNPEDVESMNILKGSAATALYGSRAANGAIIITTKKSGFAAPGQKKRFGVILLRQLHIL